MKFSRETVRGSRHGKCREISGEILLLLFPQETKLESAQNFSRLISRHFSRDVLQLQMPNFISFFILQTFVLESPRRQPNRSGDVSHQKQFTELKLQSLPFFVARPQGYSGKKHLDPKNPCVSFPGVRKSRSPLFQKIAIAIPSRSSFFTLPAFVNYFFVVAWEFCIENGGDFW